MPRSSRPISVTLGSLQRKVEKRVESGAYQSVSEVLRHAVRALEREEAAANAWLKQEIEKSINDARPSVSLDAAFEQVRKHIARRGRGKK